MDGPRTLGVRGRQPRAPRTQLFTSLKAEMLLSLAVMGTAALSLAALNVVVLQNLVSSRNGALYLALLIIADVVIFVAFGAYKLQGLVIAPLEGVVEAVEAIANGDLSRRVAPGETREFARLSRSVNRMTSRLLEEQAQRAHLEKVASVGRLAAGVAHEVGNPLGAIAGYTHLLRASVNGDASAADALAGIERESARIDRIVRGMLDYARARKRVSAPMNPNDVARDVVQMLADQGTLRGVRVTLSLSDDLPELLGDAHEMEQVFVNLVLNGVDAVDGDGCISILTERVPFAELSGRSSRRSDDPEDFAQVRDQSARVRAWLNTVGEPGEVIQVVVADTGPGVPWEQRERIFDPFFTTKEPGKGTGLGLALVSRIVEGLGGTVWVRTAREGGAAFVICLPIASAPEADVDAETVELVSSR
ncbi:MAG TPA: ATP-binding protein [Gemmatimonadaceae bacterium]